MQVLAGELARVVDRIGRSVVQLRAGDWGGGAGVVVADASGRHVVVTNAHVARGGPGARFAGVTADRAALELELVLRDPRRDLAVLTPLDLRRDRTAASLPAPAPLADDGAIRPGHLVVAVGHPMGIANAATAGIVHGIGPVRVAANLPPAHRDLPWLQADVRLAPGNSGGPLCDAAGQVIGINTMVVGGLALAVPAPDVRALLWAFDGGINRGAA